MEKKNTNKNKFFIAVIALSVLLLAGNVFLFVLNVVSLLFFIIGTIVLSSIFAIFIALFVIYKKKLKQKSELNINLDSEEDIIKLYNLAGIPIIRDANGKIKNIFELLEIEAQYSDAGKRIRTIYEILGIVPRFDKNGKEIPTVMTIKNRVKSFIKPAKKTGDLTLVLTDKEKEELLLKQMLEKKLKESEEQGDDKKAKVIKKVIATKKKESKSSSPKKGVIIIKSKSESIKQPKINQSKLKSDKYASAFKNLFSVPPAKPVPQKKPVVNKPKVVVETTKKIDGMRLSKEEEKNDLVLPHRTYVPVNRQNVNRRYVNIQPPKLNEPAMFFEQMNSKSNAEAVQSEGFIDQYTSEK